jgi:phospholipid transport system substrate-binding protein
MDRRIFLISPFALVLAREAWAQSDDVEASGREIDAILREGLRAATSAGGSEARRAAVKSFLARHADLARVSRFVLGRAARTATPDELSAFEAAFGEKLVAGFAAALERFSPESLKLVRAVARSPRDVIVSYAFTGSNGPKKASVRALRTQTQWRIVDVEAEGVWLAVLQQQQIAAMLDQPGETIATVTQRLLAQR